jgi:hypothetical protein
MKALFGDSWKTSTLGMIIGGLSVYQEYVKSGETDIYTILTGILVYLLGRFAADYKKP